MINKYNNEIINDLVLARMLNLQRTDAHLSLNLSIFIVNNFYYVTNCLNINRITIYYAKCLILAFSGFNSFTNN